MFDFRNRRLTWEDAADRNAVCIIVLTR
jgi:hypothetical protein